MYGMQMDWPGGMKWTVYWPFWVWKVLTWAFTEDDEIDENEEFKAEEEEEEWVAERIFFFSFSTCFIRSVAILSPFPPRDRLFFRSTAWASLRLESVGGTHGKQKHLLLYNETWC